MNKFLFLFFFVLIGASKTFCQTSIYYPFPDSNGVWSEHYQYTSSSGNYLYSTFGDTTIGSLKYNKLYRYSESMSIWDTIITQSNSVLVGGMREDSLKKIWFYSFGPIAPQDSIYKLYDFSKQVGDTIYFPQQFPNSAYAYQSLIVDSVDSISIRSHYRKRFYLNTNGGPGYETWIEGIGSTRSPVSTITPYLMCACVHQTVCFKYYDTVYYMNPLYNTCYPFTGAGIKNPNGLNNFAVFPNPADNYFVVEANSDVSQTAELWDVNGKLLLSRSVKDGDIVSVANLEQGVYTLTLKTSYRVVNKRIVIVH